MQHDILAQEPYLNTSYYEPLPCPTLSLAFHRRAWGISPFCWLIYAKVENLCRFLKTKQKVTSLASSTLTMAAANPLRKLPRRRPPGLKPRHRRSGARLTTCTDTSAIIRRRASSLCSRGSPQLGTFSTSSPASARVGKQTSSPPMIIAMGRDHRERLFWQRKSGRVVRQRRSASDGRVKLAPSQFDASVARATALSHHASALPSSK